MNIDPEDAAFLKRLRRLEPELIRLGFEGDTQGWVRCNEKGSRGVEVIPCDGDTAHVRVFCGFCSVECFFEREYVVHGIEAAIKVAEQMGRPQRVPKHLTGEEKKLWKMREKARHNTETVNFWLSLMPKEGDDQVALTA